MNASPAEPYFTEDQSHCLLELTKDMAGSELAEVSYSILGIADLADREAAAALLRAMQAGDWLTASANKELAGLNNLLVAVLLRIEMTGGVVTHLWAALRSPAEPMESATVLAWDKAHQLPHLEWTPFHRRGPDEAAAR